MKSQILSIDELTIDADTQARVSIHDETVGEYAEIIQDASEWPFPPLVVFHDGNRYMVADGFHRTLAAQRVNRASIPCEIRRGTARDAKIFGMTANDRHGLRRSRADKRACVEWLLDNGGKMTQAEISQTAGVTTRTVRNIVAERKEAAEDEKRKFSASKGDKNTGETEKSGNGKPSKTETAGGDGADNPNAGPPAQESQTGTDSASAAPNTETGQTSSDQCADVVGDSQDALDYVRLRMRNIEQVEGKLQGDHRKAAGKVIRKVANRLDPPAKFCPPDLEDVREYCRERKNQIDPESFMDHYTANGWRVGKGTGKPMKDWRATVRNWEAMSKGNGNSGRQTAAEIFG